MPPLHLLLAAALVSCAACTDAPSQDVPALDEPTDQRAPEPSGPVEPEAYPTIAPRTHEARLSPTKLKAALDSFSLHQVSLAYPYGSGEALLRVYSIDTGRGPYAETAVDPLIRYGYVNDSSDGVVFREWHREPDTVFTSPTSGPAHQVRLGRHTVALAFPVDPSSWEAQPYDGHPPTALLLETHSGKPERHRLLAVYPEVLPGGLYSSATAEARGDTVVLQSLGGDEGTFFGEERRLLIRGDSLQIVSKAKRSILDFSCLLSSGSPVYGTSYVVERAWAYGASGPEALPLRITTELDGRPVRLPALTDSLRLSPVEFCARERADECQPFGLEAGTGGFTIAAPADSLLLGPRMRMRDRTWQVLAFWENAWHLAPAASFDLGWDRIPRTVAECEARFPRK